MDVATKFSALRHGDSSAASQADVVDMAVLTSAPAFSEDYF